MQPQSSPPRKFKWKLSRGLTLGYRVTGILGNLFNNFFKNVISDGTVRRIISTNNFFLYIDIAMDLYEIAKSTSFKKREPFIVGVFISLIFLTALLLLSDIGRFVALSTGLAIFAEAGSIISFFLLSVVCRIREGLQMEEKRRTAQTELNYLQSLKMSNFRDHPQQYAERYGNYEAALKAQIATLNAERPRVYFKITYRTLMVGLLTATVLASMFIPGAQAVAPMLLLAYGVGMLFYKLAQYLWKDFKAPEKALLTPPSPDLLKPATKDQMAPQHSASLAFRTSQPGRNDRDDRNTRGMLDLDTTYPRRSFLHPKVGLFSES